MQTKAKLELERAFRMRAGVIGELQSCLCMYPLQLAPTSTLHADTCPAHFTRLEHERLEAQRAAGAT